MAEGTPADKIDEKAIRRHLYDPEMPDPDLVIRTSGEYRISNFLLWELAYSELVFTDVLWPDFRREHLADAVREFQRRDRRFGGSMADGGPRAVSLYRDTGVVLRTYKLGEADRIVVLLHRRPRQGAGRGQGRAQDQEPVRRPPRAAVPRRLLLYEGRELDIVSQAESHRPLPRHPRRPRPPRPGIAMLEAVDQMAQEREAEPAALPDAARRPAGAGHPNSPLLRAALLLEAAGRRGLPARARRLRELRRRRSRSWPSTSTRAACCAATCRRGVPVSPEAVELLRRMLGGELAAVLAEPVSPATHEVDVPGRGGHGAPPRAAAAGRQRARPGGASAAPGSSFGCACPSVGGQWDDLALPARRGCACHVMELRRRRPRRPSTTR